MLRVSLPILQTSIFFLASSIKRTLYGVNVFVLLSSATLVTFYSAGILRPFAIALKDLDRAFFC